MDLSGIIRAEHVHEAILPDNHLGVDAEHLLGTDGATVIRGNDDPAKPVCFRTEFRVLSAGAVLAENATVKMLIAYAYAVKDFQISGGPSWMDSERFNIITKEDESVSVGRQKLPWKE